MASKKICESCGAEYIPESSMDKYCTSCRMIEFHQRLAELIQAPPQPTPEGRESASGQTEQATE